MVKQFCVVVVVVMVVGTVRQFMKKRKGYGRKLSWISYRVMIRIWVIIRYCQYLGLYIVEC